MRGTKFSSVGCLLIVGAVLLATSKVLDASEEIFRCTLEDGSVSFQQMPCTETETREQQPPVESEKPDDDFFNVENPYDNPQPVESVEPKTATAPSVNRVDCERTTREKIDAIDAELAGLPPKDTVKELLAELMQLTRRLRTCKEL